MRSILDAAASGPASAASTSYKPSMIQNWCLAHKSLAVQRQPCLGQLRRRGDPAGLPAREHRQRLQPLCAVEDKKTPVSTSDMGAPAAPAAPVLDASPVPASTPSGPKAAAVEVEVEVDASNAADLSSMWETIKRDMRKGMSPEEAQVLDSIKLDDLLGNNGDLMRKIADEQLGPLLQSLGVHEEPMAFFLDLLRLGTGLQLLSAGALFYGVELWGGYDSGEAFRCVCGLTAGYLSRPFFKVEQLLWPLYDWGLRIIAPGAVYEVSANKEESQATLSRLGVAVAVCSFLPQLLWGWDSANCLQFVLPLAGGWLLFDVMYMAALLAKLQK